MINNDPNLITVINILNEKKIFYWIGQGTLLGIHRDNKLIEWDHDIDICVWHDSNNKENRSLFASACTLTDQLLLDQVRHVTPLAVRNPFHLSK